MDSKASREMEVKEDVRGGEEFGVHQRSEEKFKYIKNRKSRF